MSLSKHKTYNNAIVQMVAPSLPSCAEVHAPFGVILSFFPQKDPIGFTVLQTFECAAVQSWELCLKIWL